MDKEPLCGCATEIPIYLLFICIIIYLTVEFMTSGDPDYNNNNFIITEREINTQHCWNWLLLIPALLKNYNLTQFDQKFFKQSNVKQSTLFKTLYLA